jgi:DNA polymerase-3 subunit epsilon
VVVFTGELSMSRSEAADLAARVGMTVKAAETRKTTHLVVVDQDLTVLQAQVSGRKWSQFSVVF